jgi:glycosyltransferase involved in cell wall biosynthesis
MNNPRISIIIPTKNEENYIERTLQQFDPLYEVFDLEVIVSDAHSTDRTAEIVSNFHQKTGGKVHLVQPEGEQNIAVGRNAGAAMAKGALLFHTDADVLIPNALDYFSKISEQFNTRNIVAATMPIWVYPEERKWSDYLYHLLMNAVIRMSFSIGIYLAKGECQWVRRQVFEEIGGYNERLVAGEDCNLFYRLSKVGKIAYLYRMKIFHSPRRFRKYGYIGITMIYLREAVSLLFRGKSWSEEWKPVR